MNADSHGFLNPSIAIVMFIVSIGFLHGLGRKYEQHILVLSQLFSESQAHSYLQHK